MNFFRSILSDDPDSPKSEKSDESDPNPALKPANDDRDQKNDVTRDETADGWSIGGFIKTFSSRSESVIETYRRDLREFGLGLKMETEIVREAASRAVKDLPASLEAGASAAHGALDGVLKSTADLITKETLVFTPDVESETAGTSRSLNSARYSRFEAQLSAIQSDFNTFCEEPEDVDEYKKWKLGFELSELRDEIDGLIGENGAMERVYRRIVPNEVDHETFWCRYFYRVDKLKQQERVRANLVRRAISVDDDEELSWDVEDDEDVNETESGVKVKGADGIGNKGVSDGSLRSSEKLDDSSGGPHEKERNDFNKDDEDKNNVVEASKNTLKEESLEKKQVKADEIAEVKNDGDVMNEQIVEKRSDEKEDEGKGEKSEGGKESVVSQVSIDSVHNSKVEEEEDMGWDEIENIGSDDEKKISATTSSGCPKNVDLRKRLSVADDDEDLNWDIEDDDEPSKA